MVSDPDKYSPKSYQDAPIVNPYGGSRSDYGSILDKIDSNIKKEREALEKRRLRQQEAARKLEEAKVDDANSAIKRQAAEGGYEDFLYEDEKGMLQSALTPEQQEDAYKRKRQADERENAKKAAQFQITELSRAMEREKADQLSDSEVEKLQEKLDISQQSLGMYEDEITRGVIKREDAEQDMNRLSTDISMIEDQLAKDSESKGRSAELLNQKYAAEDVYKGRPEGLERPTLDTPEQKRDFLEGYNARVERYNASMRQAESDRDLNERKHDERLREIRRTYYEWLAQGVTPEEEQQGKLDYLAEIAETNRAYAQRSYDYQTRLQDLRNEDLEIKILAPYAGSASDSPQNNYQEVIEKVPDQMDQSAKEFDKFSKSAGDKMREAANIMREEEENLTPEQRTVKARKIELLTLQARAEAMQSIQQKAEQRSAFMKEMGGIDERVARAIADKNIALKEVTDKNGNTQWVLDEKSVLSKLSANVGTEDKVLATNPLTWLIAGGNILTKTVVGEFGKPDPTKELKNAQNRLGMSDADFRAALKDFRKISSEFSDNEKTRTLSDNSIFINPKLDILDDAVYENAINKAVAPWAIKSHMLKPEVRRIHQNAYAESIFDVATAASFGSIGIPRPADWYMQHYGKDRDTVTPKAVWMREYLEQYGKGNRNFGQQFSAGIGRLYTAGIVEGGGKMLTTLTALAAIAEVPGAIDLTADINSDVEYFKAGQDFRGAKIPGGIGEGIEIIFEEAPSLGLTILSGGYGRAIGAGASRLVAPRLVTRGMLKTPEAAAKFASRMTTAGGLMTMSAASGAQSLGLSWQEFYDRAYQAKKKELGRELTEDEKNEIAMSDEVLGKAKKAGIMTAVITAAFGATGIEAFAKAGTNKNFTIRDMWRGMKRGQTAEQNFNRFRQAMVGILKSAGIEAAEEATDEFLQAFVIDSEYKTLGDALAAAKEAAIAGAVLGGFSRTVQSFATSGINSTTLQDPQIAADALSDRFGQSYTPEQVEQGLMLINYNPKDGGKSDTDGSVALESLKTAIDTKESLDQRRKATIGELNRASMTGDEQAQKTANAKLEQINLESAVVKVANGARIGDVDKAAGTDLTDAERTAIRGNLPDGTAASYDINGETVISDTALAIVAINNPEAVKKLVSKSESQRVQEINQKAERATKAEEAAKAAAKAAPEAAPGISAQAGTETTTEAATETATEAATETATEAATETATEAAPEQITRVNGLGFSSIGSAKTRVKKLGFDPDSYDYIDDPSVGGVVAVPKTTSAMQADAAGVPQAAPQEGQEGGQTYRVTLRKGPTGASRTVDVVAGSKQQAMSLAVGQAKPGETVVPSGVELADIETQATPAPDAAQQAAATAVPQTPTQQADPDLETAIGKVYTSIEEDTDEAPLVGRDFKISDGRLILRRGLDKNERTVALVQALALRSGQKALSDGEAQTLYASLPDPIRKMAQKRASADLGRDATEAEAATYYLGELMTGRISSSTLKAAAKSDKKIMAAALKFYRGFLKAVRNLMNRFGTATSRQMLQRYETIALATLKELTDAKALAGLGVVLPQTRITSRTDAVLPANVNKKRAGYEVTLPGSRLATRYVTKKPGDGKYEPEENEIVVFEDSKKAIVKTRVNDTKWVKTLSEALQINATKYKERFKQAFRMSATDSAIYKAKERQGKEKLDSEVIAEAEADIENQFIGLLAFYEGVIPKLGLSAETFYAQVAFTTRDAETDTVIDAYVNAKTEASRKAALVLLKEKIANLRNLQNAMEVAINDKSLTEGTRQVKMLSYITARVGEDALAAKSIEQAHVAYMMQLRLLETLGKGGKDVQALSGLLKDQNALLTEMKALISEDFMAEQVPNKEVENLQDRLQKVNAMIEVAMTEADVEGEYRAAIKRPVGEDPRNRVRGLVDDRDASMLLLKGADASTVMHEGVHQLQYMVHPVTKKPLLDMAIGAALLKKINSWIKKRSNGANPYSPEGLERMAEGIEKYMAEGGPEFSDSATNKAFANLTKAVAANYLLAGERPGFKLNRSVRAAFKRLFDSAISISPQGIASISEYATTKHGKIISGTKYVMDGAYMIPVLPNLKPQPGYRSEKVANRMVSKYLTAYPNAEVIKDGGKYYVAVPVTGPTEPIMFDGEVRLQIGDISAESGKYFEEDAKHDKSLIGTIYTGPGATEGVNLTKKDRFDPSKVVSPELVNAVSLKEQMDKMTHFVLRYKNKNGKIAGKEVRLPEHLGGKGIAPDVRHERLHDLFVKNLIYLYDLYDKIPNGKQLRWRASLWYDGGRNLVDSAAEAYGVSPEQAAATYAALSPGKDWFQNVTMGESIMDLWSNHMDTPIRRADMTDPKALELYEAKGSRMVLESIEGKTLREVYEMAKDGTVDSPPWLTKREWDAGRRIWPFGGQIKKGEAKEYKLAFYRAVRAMTHQIHGSNFRVVYPEGGFGDLDRKLNGEPKGIQWAASAQVWSAFSVLEDGSLENISDVVSKGHKVRNFYNNLIAPNSPTKAGTIDTHHVAAAYFFPMAQKDYQVASNFGGGSFIDSRGRNVSGAGAAGNGMQGVYWMHLNSLRDAAEIISKRGIKIQPRQLQSITWEMIRQVFYNKNNSMVDKVAEVWNDFADATEFSDVPDAVLKKLYPNGIGNPEDSKSFYPKFGWDDATGWHGADPRPDLGRGGRAGRDEGFSLQTGGGRADDRRGLPDGIRGGQISLQKGKQGEAVTYRAQQIFNSLGAADDFVSTPLSPYAMRYGEKNDIKAIYDFESLGWRFEIDGRMSDPKVAAKFIELPMSAKFQPDPFFMKRSGYRPYRFSLQGAAGSAFSFQGEASGRGDDAAEMSRPKNLKRAQRSDTARMMKLLGDRLYTAETGIIIGKELLQNSLDAAMKGRKMYGKAPEIHFMSDTYNSAYPDRFAMLDNGVGMLPSDVFDYFLPAFVSGKKDPESAGGYGIAKLSFLGGPGRWNMTTIAKDGDKMILTRVISDVNGYTSFLDTEASEIDITPGAGVQTIAEGMTIEVEELPSDKVQTGFVFMAEMPEEPNADTKYDRKLTFGGAGTFVNNAIPYLVDLDAYREAGNPGIWDRAHGDIEELKERIIREGKDRNLSYSIFDRYESQVPVNSEKNEYGVIFSKETENFSLELIAKNGAKMKKAGYEGSVTIKVLNRSLYQFDQGFKGHQDGRYPEGIAVNIRPKSVPDDAGYPFTPDRENVTREVKNAVNEYLAIVGKEANDRIMDLYMQRRNAAVKIKGSDQTFLDVVGNVPDEMTQMITSDGDIAAINGHIAKVQDSILRMLDRKYKAVVDPLNAQRKTYWGRAKYAGFMTGSGAYGVHVGKSKTQEESFIYHDPFNLMGASATEFVGIIQEAVNRGEQVPESGSVEYLAAMYDHFITKFIGVALHEALHQTINTEHADLSRELTFKAGDMIAALDGVLDLGISDTQAAIYATKLLDYNEDLKDYQNKEEAKEFFSSQGAAGYLSAKPGKGQSGGDVSLQGGDPNLSIRTEGDETVVTFTDGYTGKIEQRRFDSQKEANELFQELQERKTEASPEDIEDFFQNLRDGGLNFQGLSSFPPPRGAFLNINKYDNVTIKAISPSVDEYIKGYINKDRHEEIKKLDSAIYIRRGKKLVTTATDEIFYNVPPTIAKHPLAKYIKNFKDLSFSDYKDYEVDLDLGNGVTFYIHGYRAGSIKDILQELDELALGIANEEYLDKPKGSDIDLESYAKEFAENVKRRPTIEIGDASDSKSRAQRDMAAQRKKWGKDQRSGLQYVAQQEASKTMTFDPATGKTVTQTLDVAPIAQQLLDSLPDDVLKTPNIYNARRQRAAASWQGNYISRNNSTVTYVHEVMHVATHKRIEDEIDYPIARDSITDRERQQPTGAEYLRRIKEQAKSASPEMQELVRLYLLANKNFPQLTKQSRTTGDPMSAQAIRAGISGSVGYGLANMHEFVAQSFSNKAFQEALNQIPDPESKGMTLWQNFINAIAKMFGITPKQGSVLESVIEAVPEVARMDDPQTGSLSLQGGNGAAAKAMKAKGLLDTVGKFSGDIFKASTADILKHVISYGKFVKLTESNSGTLGEFYSFVYLSERNVVPIGLHFDTNDGQWLATPLSLDTGRPLARFKELGGMKNNYFIAGDLATEIDLLIEDLEEFNPDDITPDGDYVGGSLSLQGGADINQGIPADEGGNLPPSTFSSLKKEGYKPKASEKTQIVGTKYTYEKILEKHASLKMKILDWGAGRGIGTKEGKDAGYSIKGYEPYSNPKRRAIAPDYTDEKKIPDASQDIIISNAVINVVPEKVGRGIVRAIYKKLKPGGSAFVQVMDWNSIKRRLENPKTKLVGPREVITQKGTFQKGYTSETLRMLIEQVVPNATITRTEYGNVGYQITKPKNGSGDGGSFSMQGGPSQEMVNVAAKESGYNVEAPLYRGTIRRPRPAQFVTKQGRATISLTAIPEIAELYSYKPEIFGIKKTKGSTVNRYFTKFDSPLDVRSLGSNARLDEILDVFNYNYYPKEIVESQKKMYEQLDADYTNVWGVEGVIDLLEEIASMPTEKQIDIDVAAPDDIYVMSDLNEAADALRELEWDKNNDPEGESYRESVDNILYGITIDVYAVADTKAFTEQAKKEGYDSLIHKDVGQGAVDFVTNMTGKSAEEVGFDDNEDYSFDTYRPFYQNQIKLADRKTFDDDGNEIALGDRFDTESGDFRFQGAPKDRAEGAARAKARMDKGTTQAERDKKFADRDKVDAKGVPLVPGVPERANIDTDESTRAARRVSQEIYESSKGAETWAKWSADASSMINNRGINDIELEIFRYAETGYGQAGTPEFQIAAKRVVAMRYQQAMATGNQADIDYAMALSQAEQEMRGEIARTMNAMRDPFQTPAQRAAYALGNLITSAPTTQVKALKKVHGAESESESVPDEKRDAYKADLMKVQKAHMKRAEEALSKGGIDMADIFGAANDGVAINSEADKQALSKLTDKQQAVVKMLREGKDAQEIESATGVSEKGQNRAMEKYRTELRPIVEGLADQGYTSSTIGEYVKGSPPPEGQEKAGDAEIEAMIDNAFASKPKPRGKFNINNPRHVMIAAQLIDDADLDFITRATGTWYANVFSTKTVMINLLSVPFAGYRMIAERGAESLINTAVNNPEAKKIKEFEYIIPGLVKWAGFAAKQGLIAFDLERTFFHDFARGEKGDGTISKGETHEDVRGYQLGHLADYIDIGLEKLGVRKKPSNVDEGVWSRRTKVGAALRGVLRFNMGVDEMMRYWIGGAEVGAIAYRLGRAKGLTGEDLKEFITAEMTIEGSRSWELASQEADISVFTKDLPGSFKGEVRAPISDGLAWIMNSFDKSLKDLDKRLKSEKAVGKAIATSKIGGLSTAARIDAMRAGAAITRVTLIPFTRVLMNLLGEGFKRVPNPASLVWSMGHVINYAARRRGEADPKVAKHIETLGRQMISHVIAGFLLQAMEGDDDDRTKDFLITGSMPKFKTGARQEREAAEREGMGPYRIRIGDLVIDYGRIDPLAITLGTTVDLVREAKKNLRGDKTLPESALTLAADTIASQLTDKTMLRGMNDAFMMIGGRMDAKKWAARQLATMIIPNVLRQPMRDTNEFYDAPVTSGGMEGFWQSLLYEMYPNAKEKLGGMLPANPIAPPASRDAYGDLAKRPQTGPTPLHTAFSWVFRPKKYTPNRYDEMVRRDRRRSPGEDFAMPAKTGKNYSYTDPVTQRRVSLRFTPSQYERFQKVYRSLWQANRPYATDSASIEKIRRKIRSEAMEIMLYDPVFRNEARKEFRKKYSK